MANKTLVGTKLTRLREARWSEADARIVLAALERSGDTVLGFARAHDLNAQRIYWWRSRLSGEVQSEDPPDQLSFAPVVVTGLGRTPAVVIRLGELEVEVLEPHGVDPTWLAQVLAAAKGAL